jgi:sugar/nucleoside kinase (ribokinase family)
VVITRGAEDVLLGTRGGRFIPPEYDFMPTCRYADEVVAGLTTPRDTTGCGDNFVGGLIDSIAHQMADPEGEGPYTALDLDEAVVSGIVAGSVALTCLGGVYYENAPGEKYDVMQPYFEAYLQELEELDEPETTTSKDGKEDSV